jgi:hypothetical protein
MMRRMITSFVLVSCAVFAVGSTVAKAKQTATHPTLTGTWQLDRSKGNYVELSGLNKDATVTLVITHFDPEIKVVSKVSKKNIQKVQKFTYYSDGRGEVSRTFIGNVEGPSKTQWKKDRLISTFTVKTSNFNVYVIQEWTLSADGNTLTQTQKSRLPMRPIFALTEVIRVFKRIS